MSGAGLVSLLLVVFCAHTSEAQNQGFVSYWPISAIEVCNTIQIASVAQDCIECFESFGTDINGAKNCMQYWPERFARCLNKYQDDSSIKSLDLCLKKAMSSLEWGMKTAEKLFEYGCKGLTKIGKAKTVKNGGAAAFSVAAQELMFENKAVQKLVKDDHDNCVGRFVVNNHCDYLQIQNSQSNNNNNNQNNQQRSSLERTFNYSHGVGHDMDFHGVGYYATKIMKGECLANEMKEDVHFEDFVKLIISEELSVPAWIFRELMREISTYPLSSEFSLV